MDDNYAASNDVNGFGKGGNDFSQNQALMRNRCPQYTMPGILQFLQSEWTKIELERSQWEVERAELQARIAFLQGERKGQENLKQDLVRRIKMLEFALKQERSRFSAYKLEDSHAVYPVSCNTSDDKDSLIQPEDIALNMSSDPAKWKEDRIRLKQYLSDVGYGDTIAEMRQIRVKQLLGLSNDNEASNIITMLEENLSGKEASPKNDSSIIDKGTNNDENTIKLSSELVKNMKNDDIPTDADTDEALAEFDFLVLQHQEGNINGLNNVEGAGEARSTADDISMLQGELLAEERQDRGEQWGAVDHQLISKLKEQYRQERSKGKRPNSQNMSESSSSEDESLGNIEAHFRDMSSEEFNTENSGPAVDLVDNDNVKLNQDEAAGFNSALGLGDLARLTVANESESLQSGSNNQQRSNNRSDSVNYRCTWNAKYTLRSHFDAIRAIAFHPNDPVLITASEDHTLKLWNLSKTVPAKKSSSLDVEPIYTFRGHDCPVLSLVVNGQDEAYSGGSDGKIRMWRLPNSSVLDPYDAFDPSVHGPILNAHTDAVWSLALHPKSSGMLLSAGADQTVCLWQPNDPSNILRQTYQFTDEPGVPTSIACFPQDSNHFVLGTTSSRAFVVDIETGAKICQFEPVQSNSDRLSPQINCLVTHPSLPLTITAHEDRQIRFYDNNSGKMVNFMVAHLDAVTSLSVDPNGLYLLSGSHDCSIRLWNMDNNTCVQEITSHRKKFEESIHDVAFHPTKHYLASAGADALAKVFV